MMNNHIGSLRDVWIDVAGKKCDNLHYIQCKNEKSNVFINDIVGFLWFVVTRSVNGILCYSNGISNNI